MNSSHLYSAIQIDKGKLPQDVQIIFIRQSENILSSVRKCPE